MRGEAIRAMSSKVAADNDEKRQVRIGRVRPGQCQKCMLAADNIVAVGSVGRHTGCQVRVMATTTGWSRVTKGMIPWDVVASTNFRKIPNRESLPQSVAEVRLSM